MVPALIAAAFFIPQQPVLQGRDETAIRAIVTRVYAEFNDGNDSGSRPPRLSAGLALLKRQCAALARQLARKTGEDSAYGTCANDYDNFCQCQDSAGIDFRAMTVTVTSPVRGRADASLRWSGDAEPDLKLIFVRGRTGWELDDLWEYSQTDAGQPSQRKRLAEDILSMRRMIAANQRNR